MAALKLAKFLGEAPKVSSELLPDTAAQIAQNVKLYSGDLLPYSQSSLQLTLTKAGVIQTIYPMTANAGGYSWLHWTTDVDIAKAPIQNDTTQRIYYTGDGEPRVTNYSLATNSGATQQGAFPLAYYTLGLPPPQTAPTVSAASFTTLTCTNRSRDAGNVATVTTTLAHGLNTGEFVTVSGFTDTSFNLSNVQVTVVNTTQFTYFCAGSSSTTPIAFASRARTSNVATIVTGVAHNLATGQTVSITCPADSTFNASGVTITVTNSTTFTYSNTGSNVTTTTDTTGSVTPSTPISDTNGRVDLAGNTQARTYVYTWYTAWGEESVPSPVSNILYIREGQTVTISGLPSSWPAYTGTYQTATMQLRIYRTVTSTTGSTYFLVGTVNLGTTTFTDNIPVSTLTVSLGSTYYDQPNSAMIGIQAIHNSMMMAFFGTTLCFAEIGQPHAWPIKYRQNFPDPIVSIGHYGTSIVVVTNKGPWLVQGASPSNMAKLPMDFVLPGTSKRSMVNMGYGVAWATPGGLAVYSSVTGGTEMTMQVHDWDTWKNAVNFVTMYGAYYNGKYFGTSLAGSFIFERDDQMGGYLVETTTALTAAYYDRAAANFYFVSNGNQLFLWDDQTQTFTNFTWKSKTLITKDFVNYGAARVIADYGTNANDALIAAQNNATLAANQAYITGLTNLGAFAQETFAQYPVADGPLLPLAPIGIGIQFQLFVDKALHFTTQLTDRGTFLMPADYRSDTFEVEVSGNTRVRAIHLGENALQLKEV